MDPKVGFKERYVLYLVMRGDTTYHSAILAHTYNVNGLDPLTNEIDPAIKDAVIKIWGENYVHIFRDTLISRNDTSRYNSPVFFYYLDNYKPAYSESLKVHAYLMNGIVLKAVTRVPSEVILDSVYILPVKERNDYTFSWQKNVDDLLFLYRAKLWYKHRTETEGVVTKWLEIPLELKKDGDSVKSIYPTISDNHYVRYTNEALDWTMKKISEFEFDKSMITVTRIEFEIISLDKPLSDYYAITHSYLDSYSLRLDENIYTNVEGGIGVFGVCYKQSIIFRMKEDYILSFGYKYER